MGQRTQAILIFGMCVVISFITMAVFGVFNQFSGGGPLVFLGNLLGLLWDYPQIPFVLLLVIVGAVLADKIEEKF